VLCSNAWGRNARASTEPEHYGLDARSPNLIWVWLTGGPRLRVAARSARAIFQ
jgi:hypothetical protein